MAEDDAAAWPCVSPPVNANKGKHTMKSKLKNKLVAFFKEAIRAAVAAIMGVAGAALAGCTAVTTPADTSHTIGVVGFGVPFGIQVNK